MADRQCPHCERGRFQRTPWLFTYQCDECNAATVIEDERRICCIVPFCRHTRGDRKANPLTVGMEWICERHWKLVPRALKHRKKLANKIADRAEARFMQRYEQQGGYTIAQLQRVQSAKNLAHRAWERCKAAAIERAAGL